MNKNEVLTMSEVDAVRDSLRRTNYHIYDFANAVANAVLAKLTADVELPPLLEIPSPFPYQCHDDQFIKRYAQDYALQAIARDRVRRESDCTRSHPHEEMSAMCKLRTEIAQLTNENARLKADLKADRARLAGQEPAYWHVECDDPDYSAFFPEKAEALARISDHGGTITPYYAAPVPAQAEKVEPKINCMSKWPFEHKSETIALGIPPTVLANTALQTIDPPTAPQSLLDAVEKALSALTKVIDTGPHWKQPLMHATLVAAEAERKLRAALQEHGRTK